MFLYPVIELIRQFTDEEVLVSCEDFMALCVKVAKGDGSMIATCLLTSFRVSTVNDCILGFPEDKGFFPHCRDNICGPEGSSFEIGLGLDVPEMAVL